MPHLILKLKETRDELQSSIRKLTDKYIKEVDPSYEQDRIVSKEQFSEYDWLNNSIKRKRSRGEMNEIEKEIDEVLYFHEH